ncbi:MAG: hypothetical protein HGGPFJEG_00618 [Ignavibacteria bacterium]|nr:hypothetical protein [Ignavibacteria bacterium]
MKSKIYIITFLLTATSFAFSQSLMNYQGGSSVDVQAGADICADSVIMLGTFTGAGTICGFNQITLSLNAIIEGFYNSSSNTMVSDTVKIYLRSQDSPYALVDSSAGILDNSGAGLFYFPNTVKSANYFIVVKQRNSIETWSDSAIAFTSVTAAHNFTTSAAQAYGDNMIQVDASPVRFAIYSGDVNQDGIVDATDLSLVDNDASNFVTGEYVITDLNFDQVVDGVDAVFSDNNASNFVTRQAP